MEESQTLMENLRIGDVSSSILEFVELNVNTSFLMIEFAPMIIEQNVIFSHDFVQSKPLNCSL